MSTPDTEWDFWKMLEANQFVKSTNSVTDEVEEYPPAIVDMEATVKINGEFDKYAIDEWLTSRDTYWKERVRKVIDENQGDYESKNPDINWIKAVPVKALDTLLDNLK